MCVSMTRVAHWQSGKAGDMEPSIRPGGNSDPFKLHVKPELLLVLRRAGVDLLAYDGVP